MRKKKKKKKNGFRDRVEIYSIYLKILEKETNLGRIGKKYIIEETCQLLFQIIIKILFVIKKSIVTFYFYVRLLFDTFSTKNKKSINRFIRGNALS